MAFTNKNIKYLNFLEQEEVTQRLKKFSPASDI